MRWKVVIGNLSSILKLFGFAFFIPIIPAFAYFEDPIIFGLIPFNVIIFLFMGSWTFSLGFLFESIGIAEDFRNEEAIVIVSSTWLMLAFISSIPFLLMGVFQSPINAFFEAMSGMTTTGATVLNYPLEQYPKSIMLWRGLLQWMGGMGVIVLSVAILTKLSRGGLNLLESEAPGPSITRLKPKIKETAKILWYIYGLLTFSMIILLLGAGVSPYNAVYHAFTTLSTGGFSPHTNSIAFYPPIVHWIIIFFMVAAGMNFSLHFQFFKGNVKKVFKNPELQAYLIIISIAASITTIMLIGTGLAPIDAIRDGMFQVLAIITTTGYATANFNNWPEFGRMLLLVLMFVGGSAGSTSGGIKIVRITLIFKMIGRKFKKFINPRRVTVVRMGEEVITESMLNTVAMFFSAYLLIFIIGALIIVGLGIDMVTGISAAATTIGNVGPGLGLVGPAENFRSIPIYGRFVLAILMWIGRLEIFTAIVLFNPSLYKKRGLRQIFRIRR